MAIPVSRVEVAFNAGYTTAVGSRTWTDISDYVEGGSAISIERGRPDEQGMVQPSKLSLTLDNKDGRFTPERAASPYYPNVKKGRPIRVSTVTQGNYLSANAASMETSVADWTSNTALGSFTTASSWVQSAVRSHSGTKSMLITWPTTGIGSAVWTNVNGLYVGDTYTMTAWVYVPSGSPDVKITCLFVGSGATTSLKDQWVQVSYTFVAAATGVSLGVTATTATAGNTVYVDQVMVGAGSTALTYTETLAAPTRFTGYIDAWPVVWADSTDANSLVTITASSRRARMGQSSSLLNSPLATEILADNPSAYWPMDEANDDLIFYDALGVNTYVEGIFSSDQYKPVGNDLPGPVDTGNMPRTVVGADQFSSYLLTATATPFGVTDATVEVTFRQYPVDTPPFSFANNNFYLFDNSANKATVSLTPVLFVDGTFAAPLITMSADLVAALTDISGTYTSSVINGVGQVLPPPIEDLHHMAIVITNGGKTFKSYVNGILQGTTTTAKSIAPLQRLVLGFGNYGGDVWWGHLAVFPSALSATRIAAHCLAARNFLGETAAQRTVRLGALAGIASSEISATDTTVLLPQSQKGRGPAAVLDEMTTGIGSIIYDARDGGLVVTNRNARYNVTSSFSASVAAHEVEDDLSPVLDDQSLINLATVNVGTIDPSTVSVSDATSRSEYGDYSTDLTSLSADANDATALGNWVVSRHATPRTRVRQVTFDVTNSSTALAAALLAADIGTKFTLTNLPSQAPASSMALFVEGVRESITGLQHTITFNTSPGDLDQVWVLDDAVNSILDSTTRPGF